MGIAQFASYNQQQIDQIQTMTDQIHADTQSIKNTDLANVSNKIIDFKNATRYQASKVIAMPASSQNGANTTILSVTGKGYLMAAFCQAASTNIWLDITIDGVKDEWTSLGGDQNLAMGYAPLMPTTNGVTTGSVELIMGTSGSQFKPSFLYADKASSKVSACHPVFPGEPILFSSSLLIEARVGSAMNLAFMYAVGVTP